MGKVKNKFDVIQYSFRLNLNKPSHLKIHEMLQEASEEAYGGISRLIVTLLEQYAENGALALTEPSEKEPIYVTEEELAIRNEELKKEITLDILSRLVGNSISSSQMVYADQRQSVDIGKDKEKEPEDELDPSAAEMALLYADLED